MKMTKQPKKALIPTCSLCSNFDPLRSVCKLNDEQRQGPSSEFAKTCKENGDFIRYLYVLPDTFNYYEQDELVPSGWQYDLSKVPNDPVNQLPMIVYTRRGAERPVPANESAVLRTHPAFGVPLALTYQGQRELIFLYGVDNAKREADKVNVELTVLPQEEGWEGIQPQRSTYEAQYRAEQSGATPWLSDANEDW
ncbi:hypothetical protein [Aneurinibacillus tyrosinisolvens]|uniref:hypothetical protein n=1 Tax=Aneurinibacillus tyrosinisolvens TaxID=1443435 RepID=UPI00063F71A2|nr:hypothetical protein [Aneurinibacillus tyrosinisolvens]